MRSDLALVLLSKAQVENKHILFLFKATFIFVIFMLRKILLVTEESKIIGLFFRAKLVLLALRETSI